jgi:hypothetical protein
MGRTEETIVRGRVGQLTDVSGQDQPRDMLSDIWRITSRSAAIARGLRRSGLSIRSLGRSLPNADK